MLAPAVRGLTGGGARLYVTAAYDEALAMLDRIRTPAEAQTPEARTIEQYRAFCLFALGRTAEAEQAVERAWRSIPRGSSRTKRRLRG